MDICCSVKSFVFLSSFMSVMSGFVRKPCVTLIKGGVISLANALFNLNMFISIEAF